MTSIYYRAGTAGVLCVMHYGGLETVPAIKLAQELRPIIDPIGQLPELLNRYTQARYAAATVVAEKRAAANASATTSTVGDRSG